MYSCFDYSSSFKPTETKKKIIGTKNKGGLNLKCPGLNLKQHLIKSHSNKVPSLRTNDNTNCQWRRRTLLSLLCRPSPSSIFYAQNSARTKQSSLSLSSFKWTSNSSFSPLPNLHFDFSFSMASLAFASKLSLLHRYDSTRLKTRFSLHKTSVHSTNLSNLIRKLKTYPCSKAECPRVGVPRATIEVVDDRILETEEQELDGGRVLRVGLICGGPSAERGISLNSARSVLDHIQVLCNYI